MIGSIEILSFPDAMENLVLILVLSTSLLMLNVHVMLNRKLFYNRSKSSTEFDYTGSSPVNHLSSNSPCNALKLFILPQTMPELMRPH